MIIIVYNFCCLLLLFIEREREVGEREQVPVPPVPPA